jgi:hypothetical protein
VTDPHADHRAQLLPHFGLDIAAIGAVIVVDSNSQFLGLSRIVFEGPSFQHKSPELDAALSG